jgi:SAM-dependent methyltransferase
MLVKRRLAAPRKSRRGRTMNEFIEANKRSWAKIAADHYERFKSALTENKTTLKQTQIEELGDISGASLIHLQCNTGADTVSLARLGARVTGVDLVPENVHYARMLAADFGISDARFFESNVLDFKAKHDEKYDIVFTTEGVLVWLPDLSLWARNVRHLLADDGFLYVMDGHPVYMMWDEAKLPELVVKYPYFSKTPDKDDSIGGYASEPKESVNYSWMYTFGEIITALSDAGLHVEWFHEFDWLYYRLDGMRQGDTDGNWRFRDHEGRMPYTFSLKATVR